MSVLLPVLGNQLFALDEFDQHLGPRRKPFLARFYRQVRERHGILLDAAGGPIGGQWSFVARQRDFFDRQPRLRVTVGALDRMDAARRARLFAAAAAFRAAHTLPG